MSPAHSRMEVNDRAQKLADLEDKHEHHTLAKFTETKSALEVGNFFSKQRHWKKTEHSHVVLRRWQANESSSWHWRSVKLERWRPNRFLEVKKTWECRDYEYWISHDIINKTDDFPMIFLSKICGAMVTVRLLYDCEAQLTKECKLLKADYESRPQTTAWNGVLTTSSRHPHASSRWRVAWGASIRNWPEEQRCVIGEDFLILRSWDFKTDLF